jgi:hypothetical protein
VTYSQNLALQYNWNDTELKEGHSEHDFIAGTGMSLICGEQKKLHLEWKILMF